MRHLSDASTKSRIDTTVPAAAPMICAAMNPATSSGFIPANVLLRDLATVTAGFANDVEAVNH